MDKAGTMKFKVIEMIKPNERRIALYV